MAYTENESGPSKPAQAHVDMEINQEDCESVIIKAEETRRKISIDLIQSPVSSHLPWRAQLYGPDGQKQAINDQDTAGNNGHLTRRIRKTPGSDGVSSVTCIYDLGLDMAPGPPENSFTNLGLDRVADAEIEETIRKMIEEKLKMSKMDDHEYLPLDHFEAIFSSQAVGLLIKSACPKLTGTLQERVGQIMGASRSQCLRRTLATLVMVRRVSYIERFIDEGILDSDLPIKRSHNGAKIFTTGDDTMTEVFVGWDRNDVELFFIYQEMMFVPFFDIRDDRLCYYEFGAEIRLPWQDCEAKTSGGSGLIHKVQIHPSHVRFRSPGVSDGSANNHGSIPGKEVVRRPVFFALKEIFTTDQEAYKQELHALEKSFGQKQRERHLIKLLLTFKHGEKYYLLFEWADGNLGEFWEQHHKTATMSDSWIIKQLLGISSALKSIHGLATWQEDERAELLAAGTPAKDNRQWGRHGDIKPQNILWFDSYEGEPHHLVISDLGLTQFHSQHTRSDVPMSRIPGCTQAYRAPEMSLGSNISQKYDIWSLGCVFLEFCLWYTLGIQRVQEFEDKREIQDQSDIPHFKEDKFFNIIVESGERKSFLKPCVTEYLEIIRSEKRGIAIGKILDLIEKEMLRTEPEKRENIKMICRKLLDIQKSTLEEVQPSALAPEALAYTGSQSSTSSMINIEAEAEPLGGLEPAQRDIHYHSAFYHAQGGPDNTTIGATDVNTRTRALSLGSQSARSEGEESSMENGETGTTSVNDQPMHPLELDQDSAEARRARKDVAPKQPEVARTFIQQQSTTNYTSRQTQTELSMFTQAANDASSSMTNAQDDESLQQQLHSTESRAVIAATLNRKASPKVASERSQGQPVTTHLTATTVCRGAARSLKKCTSLQWWRGLMKRRTRAFPPGDGGVMSDSSQPLMA